MTKPKNEADAVPTDAADPRRLVLTQPVQLTENAPVVEELVFPEVVRGRHLQRFVAEPGGRVLVGTWLKVAADCTSQPDSVLFELVAEDVAAVVAKVSEAVNGSRVFPGAGSPSE